LRWAYWWNSTETLPDDVTDQQALLDLNTDFRMKGMASTEITALVAAWQAGAISQDSMFELFRRSEILPDGRNNEEESALIAANPSPLSTINPQPSTNSGLIGKGLPANHANVANEKPV
jgi:hypothetical protein